MFRREQTLLSFQSISNLRPILTVSIKVISGSQFCETDEIQENRDGMNPYVEIFMRGHPLDEKANPSMRTETAQQDGLAPQFNTVFKVSIRDPESAILVFQVFDEYMLRSYLLGWYAIPVTCLR
jgi:hypothetical protein